VTQPVVVAERAFSAELVEGFERIRTAQHVPAAFAPEVEAAARDNAQKPAAIERARVDHTAVPFVTLDPAGSRDLDQAFAIERRDGGGWRVLYAIADVAAFVPVGGAVDAEANARGVTFYSPDLRTPLYPTVLGEGAASLLPDETTPALVWVIDLDSAGAAVAARLEPGTVRSRGAHDYVTVQAALDAGTADEPFTLLREVGNARQEQERIRGGVALDLPDQEVMRDDAGTYRLEYRTTLPVEGWNAQLSLLAGMEAARIMVAGGIGLLRTLPDPDPALVDALRRQAIALGQKIPADESYAELVRSVDRSTPAGAALVHQAARALRGAGYLPFDGPVPEEHEQFAVAAPYAHVTAPLRRLADRYANEVVVALCAGTEVPEWARAALPELPHRMGSANQRERSLSGAIVDFVEAMVLRSRIGERFDAVVTSTDRHGATIQLRDPAVLARLDTAPTLGAEVNVLLDAVDTVAGTLHFEVSR
jgi:exoribonuclease R